LRLRKALDVRQRAKRFFGALGHGFLHFSVKKSLPVAFARHDGLGFSILASCACGSTFV
jgi:hypothetical protein